MAEPTDQDDQDNQDIRAGSVVTYRTTDRLTGATLEGAGVVLRASRGGSAALVAPLDTWQTLEVGPDGLQIAHVDDSGQE